MREHPSDLLKAVKEIVQKQIGYPCRFPSHRTKDGELSDDWLLQPYATIQDDAEYLIIDLDPNICRIWQDDGDFHADITPPADEIDPKDLENASHFTAPLSDPTVFNKFGAWFNENKTKSPH